MLATSLTAALLGVEARMVRVEADLSGGFPRFSILGLADSAVRESEGRIRAALRNCGFDFKWDRRITVNLAPASWRKVGSAFDLALAIGLLGADGAVPEAPLSQFLLAGELALDGSLRPVAGVLPMCLAARAAGLSQVACPLENTAEASAVPGLAVFGCRSLLEAFSLLRDGSPPAPQSPRVAGSSGAERFDLSEVRGQPLARRALEIAAAGGHNLLMWGPPGSGKTMLARRLPGLLPRLSEDEALEVTAIHSAFGARLDGLLEEPPFRAPHHTVSPTALVGGGAHPRPGEVSLAHRGVLFLDELAEFDRSALEALRQPLEEGQVTISRLRASLCLPSRFRLIAATNPCPCGTRRATDSSCRCTPSAASRYLARLSGPLLDRIDLHVELEAVRLTELQGPPGETSKAVSERVRRARERQGARRGQTGVRLNAELGAEDLRRTVQLEVPGRRLLDAAFERLRLSARAHDRVLRVAATLADLDGSACPTAAHVAEALQYRRPGISATSA